MTARACPACGRPSLSRWRAATASDPHLAGGGPFHLDRCSVCGTAVTIGDAPDRSAMYEGGTYKPSAGAAGRLLGPVRGLAERDRLRFVSHLPPGSRVVEVGAGDGKLVAAMRSAGLDATGIDPSPAACAVAAAAGVEVINAGIDDAEPPAGGADAVVLWHAFEHFDDPEASLGRVREWLRPDGTVVIAVPNLGSWQAALGGDRWFHQDVPRHRTHFTPEGIGALLERGGFRVERVRHVLVEQNPLGMWQTMLNRLTAARDFAFRALKRDLTEADRPTRTRDALVTAVAGPPLAPVAVLAELIAGLARRGGSIVVEARVTR
jgi:SAM-dependent methyltransferase